MRELVNILNTRMQNYWINKDTFDFDIEVFNGCVLTNLITGEPRWASLRVLQRYARLLVKTCYL